MTMATALDTTTLLDLMPRRPPTAFLAGRTSVQGLPIAVVGTFIAASR